MNYKEIIDELLQELSYRVGIVDIYNKEQQSVMSEILTEWGEYEAKETIFRFLNEDDEKRFKNPILNRKINYVGKDGKEREGLVGNLLTSPKDSPGRIEAERLLPKEGTPEREKINQEIGSQGGGGPQDDTKGGGTDDVQQDTPQGTALKQGGYDKIVDKEEETRKKLDGETGEGDKSKPSTPLKSLDLNSRVSKEVQDELESDIKKEETLNEEILNKIPSLQELPTDIKKGFESLVARAHLFDRRANAGFGKNNFGKVDRDTLVANKQNLLELYDDANPTLVEQGVRKIRSNKVSEKFVQESYQTLPPALKKYLQGAGQAGKVVGENHFLGYETEDGSITSDINDPNIKLDENGDPIAVRGKIPNKQRGLLVWRIYLEQGGMCAYTGEPLSLEEMDLEHVVGIMNKDKGTPTEEDLLNRENERNHVITTTRANQRKKDMNMDDFYEKEVDPLKNKTDEDFQAMEDAVDEVGIMQPRTEQTAMRLMGDVIFAVKGGGSISQTDYFNLPEDQRPELTTTDLGSPKIKDATFGENVTAETLQAEFDNEDNIYGGVRKTLQEQLDGKDRTKAGQIKSKIGKRVINALGLPGNLMAPDRRTNSIGPDSFYRGYALAIASAGDDEKERLKELWQEARAYANSEEVRLGGRQKDAFVQFIRERNGIPDFILNDKRYKKVWSYKDEAGVTY